LLALGLIEKSGRRGGGGALTSSSSRSRDQMRKMRRRLREKREVEVEKEEEEKKKGCKRRDLKNRTRLGCFFFFSPTPDGV
jgi:hypothetical protein